MTHKDESLTEPKGQSEHALLLKNTLIPALRELGITKLTIHYDGSGDEGRLGDIELEPQERVLPSDLEDSLRDQVDALLMEQHGSWGDGEGATGTVLIDTVENKVINEHGWYVSDVEYSTSEF